jgi:hypothetical protein
MGLTSRIKRVFGPERRQRRRARRSRRVYRGAVGRTGSLPGGASPREAAEASPERAGEIAD